MKNIILAFVATLLSLPSFSQEWRTEVQKGDELLGTKDCTSYIYEDSIGTFVFWSDKEDHFKVMNKQHGFMWRSDGSYIISSVTVGLYTSDDKLKEKITFFLDVDKSMQRIIQTRNVSFMNRPTGQGKKAKKILNHLCTTDGYIRFIAPQVSAPNFDFKVKCVSTPR